MVGEEEERMRHLARKPIPAFPAAPVGSLAEALAAVPDPRQPFGWRRGRAPLPLVAVLQVSVAALVCGAQSLAALAQWSRERLEDAPERLLALGLPSGRSPSVATRHRLLVDAGGGRLRAGAGSVAETDGGAAP